MWDLVNFKVEVSEPINNDCLVAGLSLEFMLVVDSHEPLFPEDC